MLLAGVVPDAGLYLCQAANGVASWFESIYVAPVARPNQVVQGRLVVQLPDCKGRALDTASSNRTVSLMMLYQGQVPADVPLNERLTYDQARAAVTSGRCALHSRVQRLMALVAAVSHDGVLLLQDGYSAQVPHIFHEVNGAYLQPASRTARAVRPASHQGLQWNCTWQ